MHYIFIKVRQEDIFMIKFLLEAYENIMDLSTIDKTIPKIQVTVAPDYVEDANAILNDLAKRFYIERMDEDHTITQGRY